MSLDAQAAQLLAGMAQGHDHSHDLDYRSDGGWARPGQTTQMDDILNASACLLALCKHLGTEFQGLTTRIANATGFLNDHLQRMDLAATIPVGFELLLPALLTLLEQEGVLLKFPAYEQLLAMREKKLARIDLDSLYSGSQSSILHSIEAFSGLLDFDRLRHQKIGGSIMASPSATAAYLMNLSTWDDEAEGYLHHVVAAGDGKGNGGVPSAFPSTNFEYAWVLATLLGNGFSEANLGASDIELARQILSGGFASGSGLLGLAPLVEPDADDTAKGLIAMAYLGRNISPERLISTYRVGDHFQTYAAERVPSITTNCNALMAICLSPQAEDHESVIIATTQFLCQNWRQDMNQFRDKWHISPFYPIMLLVQSLMHVLSLWSQSVLTAIPSRLLRDVLIVLIQALERLLQSQRADGSWEGKHEITAYAIISLSQIASLPVSIPLVTHIESCLDKGRTFLGQGLAKDMEPEHVWVEKVTYGSRNLRQSFILAALKCAISDEQAFSRIHDLLPRPLKAIMEPAAFFRQLPMFANIPKWVITAALIEGSLYTQTLREACLKVFPGSTTAKERHLAFGGSGFVVPPRR
ncbi:Uu.00g035170.m01.CDS01 [Anthostomella pinea]|uniref:Uu.00g035170.m01.CDS01 n=1 Tax=Anthostomella pinea TaxID=933095 RepID=A0AAI8V923_9PEZI|nr:Uu.00g035170.m01.CDS01 [Anthostomella pinea]